MYFIRRETPDGSVTFWRGESAPAVWIYHRSDAARFPAITTAQAVFKRATGYETSQYPHDTVNVVGG